MTVTAALHEMGAQTMDGDWLETGWMDGGQQQRASGCRGSPSRKNGRDGYLGTDRVPEQGTAVGTRLMQTVPT